MNQQRNLVFAGLIVVFLLTGSLFGFAVGTAEKDQKEDQEVEELVIKEFTPVSLDETEVPAYDYQQANKLPRTGYFEKSFVVNGQTRFAKFYLAATASIRTFFTVIAVPEGVDTTEFLVSSGWHDIADENEEGLVLLEPGSKGWGLAESEEAYINAVINFYKNNDYFSIFGINYFVGYNGGGTVMEAWTAANPLMVIAQAYVNSESLSSDFYSQFSEMYFDGLATGYEPIEIPGSVKFTYDEVPVPTAFINSDLNKVSRGISYWKSVNDTVSQSVSNPNYLYGADIYKQSADSDAWATKYTGSISKVVTLEAEVDVMDPQLSRAMYDFVTEYVSYDNSIAYGNHLAPRAEYGEIGTMIVNGQLREFQIYEPDFSEKNWPNGAPVLFVFAGNTQTDKVFFHNTLWWKVADKEGFLLVIPCETYSRSSTSVSHADTGMFYEKLAEYITKYYNVDTSRFYATGQSAGSFASQGFGITNPEYFAAIASTSGVRYISNDGNFGSVPPAEATYEMIPTYCMIGEGDIGMMTGTLWDDKDNMLDGWAEYYLEANGVGPLGNGSNVEKDGRYTTWTWTNDQGVPLFKVTRTAYRAHNCIPAEMPYLWEYLSHWTFKDGVRYYDSVPLK